MNTNTDIALIKAGIRRHLRRFGGKKDGTWGQKKDQTPREFVQKLDIEIPEVIYT